MALAKCPEGQPVAWIQPVHDGEMYINARSNKYISMEAKVTLIHMAHIANGIFGFNAICTLCAVQ